MFLDGFRERIVLKSDILIRRSTSMKMSEHEAIWEGCVRFLFADICVSTELSNDKQTRATPAARVVVPPLQRKVDPTTKAVTYEPCDRKDYYVLLLQSVIASKRLMAAQILYEEANTYNSCSKTRRIETSDARHRWAGVVSRLQG